TCLVNTAPRTLGFPPVNGADLGWARSWSNQLSRISRKLAASVWLHSVDRWISVAFNSVSERSVQTKPIAIVQGFAGHRYGYEHGRPSYRLIRLQFLPWPPPVNPPNPRIAGLGLWQALLAQ